jgi:hypothetical protein
MGTSASLHACLSALGLSGAHRSYSLRRRHLYGWQCIWPLLSGTSFPSLSLSFLSFFSPFLSFFSFLMSLSRREPWGEDEAEEGAAWEANEPSDNKGDDEDDEAPAPEEKETTLALRSFLRALTVDESYLPPSLLPCFLSTGVVVAVVVVLSLSAPEPLRLLLTEAEVRSSRLRLRYLLRFSSDEDRLLDDYFSSLSLLDFRLEAAAASNWSSSRRLTALLGGLSVIFCYLILLFPPFSLF